MKKKYPDRVYNLIESECDSYIESRSRYYGKQKIFRWQCKLTGQLADIKNPMRKQAYKKKSKKAKYKYFAKIKDQKRYNGRKLKNHMTSTELQQEYDPLYDDWGSCCICRCCG